MWRPQWDDPSDKSLPRFRIDIRDGHQRCVIAVQDVASVTGTDTAGTQNAKPHRFLHRALSLLCSFAKPLRI